MVYVCSINTAIHVAAARESADGGRQSDVQLGGVRHKGTACFELDMFEFVAVVTVFDMVVCCPCCRVFPDYLLAAPGSPATHLDRPGRRPKKHYARPRHIRALQGSVLAD